MSKPYPDDPYLTGNFAPVGFEADAHDVPLQGEFPDALDGTLYRNGPNPQFAPRERYHWFLGDGMIHAFRVAGGKVSYRNRFVRTPRFELERGAGRALFGAFGNPMTTDPSAQGTDSGVANTNIVSHAGRLFALEEAHHPFELDPVTLAPKGYEHFGGKITNRFTAHPKFDPETGEMIAFGYSANGFFTDDIGYCVFDREGRLSRADVFRAPYSSMIHDFMVTKHHVLFPVLPLTGSMSRAMSGKPAYAWEPDKGSHIGVLDRREPNGRIRWFQGPPSYVFHPMNAWEEDGRIIAHVMRYAAAPLFPNADGSRGDDKLAVASLWRWTFDLKGDRDTYTEEPLDDLLGEFPRFDERRSGLPYRHGYYAFYEPARRAATGSFTGLAHLDLQTGSRRLWRTPDGDAVSEPVFVPRSADAPEGDGFLLAVAFRGATRTSDLLCFDTAAIDKGPIGTAMLSSRMPYGFHGNWVARN